MSLPHGKRGAVDAFAAALCVFVAAFATVSAAPFVTHGTPAAAASTFEPSGSAPDSGIVWRSFDEALARASAVNRPVFVYVRAPWCGPCYRVEEDVLPDLASALVDVPAVKIDLADRPEPGLIDRKAHVWARDQGLATPPAFAVLTPEGATLAVIRGYTPAERLRIVLAQAVARYASDR